MNPVAPVTNTLIGVRRLAVIGLALAVAAGATPAGHTAGAGEGGPQSFALAIGSGNLAGGPGAVAERLGDFDLAVVDGEEASAAEIAALRDDGDLVLGYLSVGTIERWRSWYPRLKRFRLGAWADWKDEWFADVSRAKLRRRLSDRIAPMLLAKGFDGLFLDNVDMIEARRHRPQRAGMRTLVEDLAALVRADGRLLFAQNGAWGLRKLGLVDVLDGWNREDVTWTYDFDRRRYVHSQPQGTREALAELAEFGDRGLVVTATDYTRADDRAALREATDNACSVGALPYVADIGLTARRLPDPPLRCP
jgi:uncharacterized protein (TIGR01370 family)